MKNILKMIGILLVLLLLLGLGYYYWGMSPVSSDSTGIVFTIAPGTSKTDLASQLESVGLIHNAYVLDAYMYIESPKIQAGEYLLNKAMKPSEMIRKFENGEINEESVKVTLLEGKKITDYATTLSDALNFSYDEFMNQINDKTYLQSLVDSGNYWFLSKDILEDGIYYPLEGYMYPDTYEFMNDATPKDVIEKILKHTGEVLDNYQDAINKSGYTTHQILTMASIVEKEANTASDRATVAQVFWTRLKENWPLGSEVTAFYGAKKELGKDAASYEVISDTNPYNTYLTDGSMNGKLPIGPICNPSEASIKATLNPSDTHYYWFVANTCTGEVFFYVTSAEFGAKVTELQRICSSN